jgi:hypothetical protein
MPSAEATVRLSARYHALEKNNIYSDLIIGFDGSDAGHDGLALGRRLAQATGARPTVVYARSYMALTPDIRESGEDLSWDAAAQRILDEAREVLAECLERRTVLSPTPPGRAYCTGSPRRAAPR